MTDKAAEMSQLYAFYFSEDGDYTVSVVEDEEEFAQEIGEEGGRMIDIEKPLESQWGYLLIRGELVTLRPKEVVKKWTIE